MPRKKVSVKSASASSSAQRFGSSRKSRAFGGYSSDDSENQDEAHAVQASKLGSRSPLVSRDTNKENVHLNDTEELNTDDVELEVEIPLPPEPVMNFDGTGPRLVISHIVNENFKSYFGRHTLGPFHKSFTSIVGPNGSGKSNVIDSMLFVFGYRSQKIRSKKLSALIHNSERHQHVEFCTVEVHFQKIIDTENDAFDIIPDSGFYVSRTAYQDNSSVYSVSGRRVQYKDVGKLLRENGIDIDHNRFLILQGEVEQIAMMKPKAQNEGDEGMLEFLEDIVGSSRFKVPIEELSKKVEELNELRQEKLNRVKVVEKEKEQLEAAKNQAVEFLKMENDLIKLKHTVFQTYVQDCIVKCDQITNDTKDFREDYEKMNVEAKEMDEKCAVKRTELENFKSNHDSLLGTIQKHKALFADLEKRDVKCREDIKHAKNKAKKLQKQLETENEKLQEAVAQPEKSEKEMKELDACLTQLETKRKEADEKYQQGMQKLRAEVQPFQSDKEEQEEVLLKFQQAINESKQKVDLVQSELDICLSSQLNEERKLSEMQQALKQATGQLADRKRQFDVIQKEIPKMEQELHRSKQELEEVKARETQLTNELRNERHRAEEARSSMHANRSRGRVLDAIMEQQRSGKLKGIYGRLGDLGAIDEQYDVAISTACGPLDNIVVDTIDTAQACVEFLKRSGVGQATFIGLDKIEKFRRMMNERIQTPENVPRLFDLIDIPNENVRPAFYFALRDTLVARDLDQATRIGLQGHKRFRVVTLNGELIDQSGTMSGGGGRPSRGRMGRTVVDAKSEQASAQQLTVLEESLASKGKELEQLRRRHMELESIIERLNRDLSQMQPQAEKCRLDIKALSDQERKLLPQIDRQQKVAAETVPDEGKVLELRKSLDNRKTDYEKASKSAEGVESAVQKLSDQIKLISDRLVGTFEKKLKELKHQIDEVHKNKTKLAAAAKSSERNVKKAEERIAEVQDNVKENDAAMAQLTVLIKELEDEAVRLYSGMEQFQEDATRVEEELKEGGKELQKLEQKKQKLVGDLIGQKAKLENIEKTVKECNQKRTYWERELNKLQLNNVEDLSFDHLARLTAEDSSVEDSTVADAEKLATLTPDELQNVDVESIKYKITIAEEKLLKLKPNMGVIEEYKQKVGQYVDRVKQLNSVTKRRDRHRQIHDQLRKQRLEEFLAGFTMISQKLKEMYQMITLGGDAELELVDTMDPFAEGIVFSVRPPKKSWKQISNLSGGEKTLSSLALVFALHHYKPTPLYVMDEIDAALDFKNVSIVANYIKDRTKNAQFIIISLRNNMFELANRLVGIYKTYHCTKSVVIDPGMMLLKSVEHEQ